jgi:hypothetical protein
MDESYVILQKVCVYYSSYLTLNDRDAVAGEPVNTRKETGVFPFSLVFVYSSELSQSTGKFYRDKV